MKRFWILPSLTGFITLCGVLFLVGCGSQGSNPPKDDTVAIFSVVSAASYKPTIAPASVATIFGTKLASDQVTVEDPSGTVLPMELGGVTVQINGLPAELLYVSPLQINFIVPEGVAPGEATVEVFNAGQRPIALTRANVTSVAPGLFTADGSESGPGAIVNAITHEPGPFKVETPENPTNDKRTRLAVFGTGFRFADLNDLIATAADYYGNSWTLQTESIGPSNDRPGVDKLVLVLPGEVDTSGIVNITLSTGSGASTIVSKPMSNYASGMVNLAASTNSGTSNTVSSNIQSLTTCNVPINFQEDPVPIGQQPVGRACPPYSLCFNYSWDSDSGRRATLGPIPLPDLSHCNVFEHVEYPGSNPFEWQSPPFLFVETENPYEESINGSRGILGDVQRPGTGTLPPFVRDTGQPWKSVRPFTATQGFYYVCNCTRPFDMPGTKRTQNFSIRREITRSVDVGPDGNGFYSIIKGVRSAAWELLPRFEECERTNTCSADPTFIQISERKTPSKGKVKTVTSANGLVAKISVPYEDVLVRAEVPIFGLAYGDHFKSYRVEVGKGDSPSEWKALFESFRPEIKDVTHDDLDSSANLPIRGNLATWDTGLTNYVYLPSHPKDHPVLPNGTYTIRLIVTGQDGNQVQDQVRVAVASEVPNAWGGTVISSDGKVNLRIPEQALADSFRLVSIEAASSLPYPVPDDHLLVGVVYEMREAGERFAKDATLQFNMSKPDVGDRDLSQIGIYAFDGDANAWKYLESTRAENTTIISTKTRRLYSHYTLMASQQPGEGSKLQKEAEVRNAARTGSSADHYWVRNDFEKELQEWSNRDNEFGASVSLDRQATLDGSGAVKIIKAHPRGNFAVNVIQTPFDTSQYGVVQFDYRVPHDVKTNFLVKVAGRWYEIGFTGGKKELKNRRVNIAHIGDIEGIVPDDQWHTAQFNLYDMLRSKTHHTIIEEMIMADWEVPGYMKLKYGTSPEGATYYIDNFSIAREASPGLQLSDRTLLIDNFNQKKSTNAFGGTTAVFVAPSAGKLETAFAAGENGYALALTYDVTAKDSYTGYVSNLPDLDLRRYTALSVAVKADSDTSEMMVGVRDHYGREVKVPVGHYLEARRVSTKWQVATIPLVAFSDKIDWSRINGFSFSFEHSDHSAGMIMIDNIQVDKSVTAVEIDHFERSEYRNLLNLPHMYVAQGAAAINGRHVVESGNRVFEVSYGGNIGTIQRNDKEPFSFGMWKTELGGIDCSKCGTISFRIRGAEGGESPNIYLSDGTFRWGVDIEAYVQVTKEWQEARIPLKAFSDYGVDLTHLDAVEVVFEWEKMSGTVYLDEIRLGDQRAK